MLPMTPSEAAELRRRIDHAIASLPLGEDGLLGAPVHIPGLFAPEARAFQPEAFAQRIAEQRRVALAHPALGYGNVWYQGETSYHAWFEDEVERIGERSPQSFAATTTLPLPAWAIAAQERLLERLYRGAFGWSVELFWTDAAGASIGAHADNDDVYTVQVLGRKHWRVDPVNLPRLRALEAAGVLQREGPHDAWHAPPDADPAFLSPLDVVLEPGDLFAIPAFALHRVEALADNPRSLAFNASICQEQVYERWTGDSAGLPIR